MLAPSDRLDFLAPRPPGPAHGQCLNLAETLKTLIIGPYGRKTRPRGSGQARKLGVLLFGAALPLFSLCPAFRDKLQKRLEKCIAGQDTGQISG